MPPFAEHEDAMLYHIVYTTKTTRHALFKRVRYHSSVPSTRHRLDRIMSRLLLTKSHIDAAATFSFPLPFFIIFANHVRKVRVATAALMRIFCISLVGLIWVFWG